MKKDNSMAMQIDANRILEERLAVSMGLDKYKSIIRSVNTIDVSQDTAFQRLFNGFYLVRRNETWRNEYYALFESMKTIPTSFGTILTALFEKTGNIESSFSSKMLSTVNPHMPIWDRYVLQNLGLKLTGSDRNKRLNRAIEIYNDICSWYNIYLKTDNAKECLAVFNHALPRYAWLSETKKIDCFLWSMR